MQLLKLIAMSRRFWLVWMALGLLLVGWLIIRDLSLSALDEPGRVETALATAGKHFLIGRSAEEIVPASESRRVNPGLGRGLFVGECSACHGIDGRTATGIGSRMYPRAADLGSPGVQGYSDEEIFWIIKNGIRLTGMPGLGDTQPDDNIWAIVDFIRSLPDAPSEEL